MNSTVPPTRKVHIKAPGLILKGNPKDWLTEILRRRGAYDNMLTSPTPADKVGSFRPKPASSPRTLIAVFNPTDMNAEMIVKLIEEMVDIKVQQQVELPLHARPELARLLEEKRHGDRRRLELIKQELTRLLA